MISAFLQADEFGWKDSEST